MALGSLLSYVRASHHVDDILVATEVNLVPWAHSYVLILPLMAIRLLAVKTINHAACDRPK